MSLSPPFLQEFARTLIDAATVQGLRLRVFGGIGIRIHCPGMNGNGFGYAPNGNDIDFVADSTQITEVDDFLRSSRCTRDDPADFYLGGEHRRYQFRPQLHPDIVIELDVYFGQLRFNHLVPLPYFEDDTRYTLPITQLMLSKLAIVNLSSHDVDGISSILAEHQIGETPDMELIQKPFLKQVWGKGASGWRLAKTCAENIRHIRHVVLMNMGLSEQPRRAVTGALDELERMIVECPKSFCWRVRDAVGTRFMGFTIRWYDETRPSE